MSLDLTVDSGGDDGEDDLEFKYVFLIAVFCTPLLGDMI